MGKRSRRSQGGRKRKRRRKRKRAMVMFNRFSPIPMSMSCRMRYSQCISLNPAAIGNFVVHVFRANSIFDPDETGVGHQPYGHDEISQFYDHYRVTSSKIRCTFNQSTVAINVPLIAAVLLNDDNSSSIVSPEHLIESGLASYRILTPDPTTKVTVKSKFKASKFFKNQKDALSTSAPVGSNPTEEATFLVMLAGQCATSTDPAAVFVQVTIDYNVTFSERKEIGQS